MTASELLKVECPIRFNAKTVYRKELKYIEWQPGALEEFKNLRLPVALTTNTQRPDMEYKLTKLGLTEVFKQRFCVKGITQANPPLTYIFLQLKPLNPKNRIVL